MINEKQVNLKAKNNSLGLFRYIAALNVFLEHALLHLGFTNLPLPMRQFLNIFEGVPVFFMLSGFLLWLSLRKDDSFKSFAKKRVLRIYPELWVGVLLNAIIIICFMYSSINWPDFIIFNIGQATFFQFWTPDSLKNYGVGCPNGSLWTITVMLQSYLILWCIFKLVKKKRFALIVLDIFFVLLNFSQIFVGNIASELIYKMFNVTFIPYFWLFLLGATLAEFFDCCIPFLKKYWIVFLILLVGYSFIPIKRITSYDIIKSILCFLFILGFSYRFTKLRPKIDITYGFYLYHMIVINIFVSLNLINEWYYILFVALITLMLAFIIDFLFSFKKRLLNNSSFKEFN